MVKVALLFVWKQSLAKKRKWRTFFLADFRSSRKNLPPLRGLEFASAPQLSGSSTLFQTRKGVKRTSRAKSPLR